MHFPFILCVTTGSLISRDHGDLSPLVVNSYILKAQAKLGMFDFKMPNDHQNVTFTVKL